MNYHLKSRLQAAALAVCLSVGTAGPMSLAGALLAPTPAEAGILGDIKGAAKKVGGAVKNGAKAYAGSVKDSAKVIGSNIKAKTKTVARGVKDGAKAYAGSVKDSAKIIGRNIKGALRSDFNPKAPYPVYHLPNGKEPGGYARQPVIHLPNGKEPGGYRPPKKAGPMAASRPGNKMSMPSGMRTAHNRR
jgi:hypothetical protein